MKKEGVALAYFISPNPLALDLVDTPMMNTVWDLGHRDLPEFLEITGDRHYEERETFFSHVLPKSFRVFVDTESTAKKIVHYYGVDPTRIARTGLIFKTETRKQEAQLDDDELQGKLFSIPSSALAAQKTRLVISCFC